MESSNEQKQVLLGVYTEVRQRFAGLNDLAHGWEHIERVYRLAIQLAEQESASRFIVGMAALMHDLGHVVEAESGEHHADLSVRAAKEIMQAYDIAEEEVEAIVHAIVAHSFSRGEEPRTLEARVVRDADRLDALGALGIMRWAIVGSQRSTTQTRVYNPADPFVEQRTPDDHIYMLDHFYAKLLKLSESMLTESGQRLAQRRTAFMHAYLAEFQARVGGCTDRALDCLWQNAILRSFSNQSREISSCLERGSSLLWSKQTESACRSQQGTGNDLAQI